MPEVQRKQTGHNPNGNSADFRTNLSKGVTKCFISIALEKIALEKQKSKEKPLSAQKISDSIIKATNIVTFTQRKAKKSIYNQLTETNKGKKKGQVSTCYIHYKDALILHALDNGKQVQYLEQSIETIKKKIKQQKSKFHKLRRRKDKLYIREQHNLTRCYGAMFILLAALIFVLKCPDESQTLLLNIKTSLNNFSMG